MTRPEQVLAAIGGMDNVISIEPCVTRLRCQLREPDQVDRAALRDLGVHGVTARGTAYRSSSVPMQICWPVTSTICGAGKRHRAHSDATVLTEIGWSYLVRTAVPLGFSGTRSLQRPSRQ